jgi:hypothetical protein
LCGESTGGLESASDADMLSRIGQAVPFFFAGDA